MRNQVNKHMSYHQVLSTLSLLFILIIVNACGRNNNPNNTITPVSYSESPSPATSSTLPTGNSNYPQFQGSSYAIEYPRGFTIIPSIKNSNANSYDSAFFQSPDGKVFFYICSAQWIAHCSDICLYTIRAKDDSYLRSYQEVKSISGYTRSVVGLKYKDEEALEQYRSEYLRFKQSFKPF